MQQLERVIVNGRSEWVNDYTCDGRVKRNLEYEREREKDEMRRVCLTEEVLCLSLFFLSGRACG